MKIKNTQIHMQTLVLQERALVLPDYATVVRSLHAYGQIFCHILSDGWTLFNPQAHRFVWRPGSHTADLYDKRQLLLIQV